MKNLKIDFASLKPYVISAFTEVYGEEYSSIISKKINNSIVAYYYDIGGLADYIRYIKKCKRCEYSIKFLELIGVDVKKYKNNSHPNYLDDELKVILDYYIGSLFLFNSIDDVISPIRTFHSNNNTNPDVLLENKLSLINYLLGSEHEEITKENFSFFEKTEKYLELLKKIEEFNKIYEILLKEYNEWKIQLLPIEQYIESERVRKKEIYQKKKDEMLRDLILKLPLFLQNAI